MEPPADVADISDIGRDPDAFEAFYRQHLPWVRRFVARRVDDPHTAADLTADIFLAVIDSAARYDPSAGSATAWLAGIARHVVADHVRRRARE
jgi:RNA polymerase sigma factor (sigma-70 family)